MSQVTYKEKPNTDQDNWRIMMISASFGSALPSPANAIAAATMLNTSSEYSNRPVQHRAVKKPSLWKVFKEYLKDYRDYRRLTSTVGTDLEIPFYRVNDIVTEARRYKWIEAEKAGRDIWVEKCPADPDGCALREWVARHFESWKKTNLTQPA